MRYLLDICVISDFVAGYSNVVQRLKSTPKVDVAVSVITRLEVEYGLLCNPAKAARLRSVLDALFHDLTVLPFTNADALAAASIRADLRAKGTPIGA